MAEKAGFRARVGDSIHVHSRKRHGPVRVGEIIEVRGEPGDEYYLVSWPRGRESLIHPGFGVTIPEVDARARAEEARVRAQERSTPQEQPEMPASETAEDEQPEASRFELHKATQSSLRAEPGDRLAIKSRRLGGYERDAEILEVLGEDGEPPYLVRWSDTGRETITRPGSDAYVEHLHSREKS